MTDKIENIYKAISVIGLSYFSSAFFDISPAINTINFTTFVVCPRMDPRLDTMQIVAGCWGKSVVYAFAVDTINPSCALYVHLEGVRRRTRGRGRAGRRSRGVGNYLCIYVYTAVTGSSSYQQTLAYIRVRTDISRLVPYVTYH